MNDFRFTKENTITTQSEIYYNTPSDWAKENLMYLEESGHFVCDSRFCVNRKGFDSYLAFLTKKGEGTIITEQGQLNCREGDLTLINCCDPHTYFARENWDFMWFHFNGKKCAEVTSVVFENGSTCVNIPKMALSVRFFEQLVMEHIGGSRKDEIMVSSYIQYILAEMVSYSGNLMKLRKTHLLNDAIAYIEKNYMRPMTITDISDELNISKSNLCHTFKKETGFSPYEFIVNMRMNKAKELLKTTNMSVGEISSAVGFNSEANFIKCFRERSRMTPTAFRKTRNVPSDFVDVYFGKKLYHNEDESKQNALISVKN